MEAPVLSVLVLVMINELPPVFKPSIVTLSAPFKPISGNGREPDTVTAVPPLGEMVNDAQEPPVG